MAREQKNTSNRVRTPAKKVSGVKLAPRLVFILTTLILILLGLIMVFSASSVEAINNNETPYAYLYKQSIYLVIGLVFAFIFWRVCPISFWRSWASWVILAILFVAMLATLFMGADILGARRWLYIAGISIQPSEFGKIVLVLVVAKIYTDYSDGIISFRRFLVSTLLTCFITLGFILGAQSDLGTTIICTVGIISVFWIGGAHKRIVIFLVCVVIVGGILFIVSSGYRSGRMVFLDPYNDGAGGYGGGYQTIRSWYALADGKLFGVGLGNSHEKFQYLPEAETDYIFAIIGEELGFIGAMFVILLFVIFLISGLYIAKNCSSKFSSSVAGSLVIMIVFQACLNILCVIGLAPTTGKPLPFISSGGSSLVASLIMVGLVLAASEEPSAREKYAYNRNKIHSYSDKKRQARSSQPDLKKETLQKTSTFKSSSTFNGGLNRNYSYTTRKRDALNHQYGQGLKSKTRLTSSLKSPSSRVSKANKRNYSNNQKYKKTYLYNDVGLGKQKNIKQNFVKDPQFLNKKLKQRKKK